MFKSKGRGFDPLLLAAAIILVAIGIAIVHSATYSAEADLPLRERSAFRQLVFGATGLAILLLAAAVDYRLLGLWPWVSYGLAIATLALVAARGSTGFGAQSWLGLGAGVQPSELAKVLLTVFLAGFLAKHKDEIRQARWLLLSAAFLLPPVLLVYRQPDLGTALVVSAIWLGVVFAAGVRLLYLAGAGVLAAAAAPVAWLSLRDYMRERILVFVRQLMGSQGAGAIADYNTRQALTSIGSGGLFGKGFLHGTQSQLYFLRVRHTDYVFSVLGEELGFVGTILVLGLFLVLIWRILRAAQMARDTFGQLIAAGVATMIFVQTAVNIGVNIGLLPVTGLTLPLVSYGGSSLWTTLLGIGLVESVAVRHKKLEFGE